MAQNWQTWYFWNQEEQEALDFQYEPIRSTLFFCAYVVLSKNFGAFVSVQFSTFFKNSFTECFLLPKGMLWPCQGFLAQHFDKSDHPNVETWTDHLNVPYPRAYKHRSHISIARVLATARNWFLIYKHRSHISNSPQSMFALIWLFPFKMSKKYF